MRFDLVSPRPKKDGGTFWHRVGTAFPSEKGGFSLMFDSLPVPDKEGRVVVKMWEQKPRQDNSNQSPPPQRRMDDEIPWS